MTQVGQYANVLQLLDETTRLHHLRVSISILSRVIGKKGLGDEESFESREPAQSFLKLNSVACDYLLMHTQKAHPGILTP